MPLPSEARSLTVLHRPEGNRAPIENFIVLDDLEFLDDTLVIVIRPNGHQYLCTSPNNQKGHRESVQRAWKFLTMVRNGIGDGRLRSGPLNVTYYTPIVGGGYIVLYFFNDPGLEPDPIVQLFS